MKVGLGRWVAGEKVRRGEPGLEGCIKTLLVIEGGDFPDEGCRGCENLKKCLKLEPGVRRGLAAEK